jgi:hypothetical protein
MNNPVWIVALQKLTGVAVAVVDMHRVSLWRYNENGSKTTCENLYYVCIRLGCADPSGRGT